MIFYRTWMAVIGLVLIGEGQMFAGFEYREGGARAIALGGAYTGFADDGWSAFYNPAGLSQVGFPEAAVFYSPQPFAMPELRYLAFVLAYPTSVGTFGVSGRRFGFELYRETSFGLSYAAEVGGLFVGANVNYHSVTIARYGNGGTFGMDVGMLVPVFQTLRWGVAATNINAPHIGTDGEKLPQVFTTGISYRPIPSLSFGLDYEKEIGFAGTPKFGCEYWVIDEVALRAGFVDEPTLYTMGMGVRYSFFQVDYGVTIHRVLGLTHQMSVTLRWLSDHD